MILLVSTIYNFNFLVDGNWGEWEPSTDCSKTCGGGTQERTRTCSNPIPENGGSNCTSSDDITGIGAEQIETDVATCNDFPCPPKGMFELIKISRNQDFSRNDTIICKVNTTYFDIENL